MFGFMYWYFWLALMLVLLFPVGYGWGYKGWGVPYPSYIQRRRMQRATANGTLGSIDHQAWGRGGDFIWAMLLCEVMFVAVLCLWR